MHTLVCLWFCSPAMGPLSVVAADRSKHAGFLAGLYCTLGLHSYDLFCFAHCLCSACAALALCMKKTQPIWSLTDFYFIFFSGHLAVYFFLTATPQSTCENVIVIYNEGWRWTRRDNAAPFETRLFVRFVLCCLFVCFKRDREKAQLLLDEL